MSDDKRTSSFYRKFVTLARRLLTVGDKQIKEGVLFVNSLMTRIQSNQELDNSMQLLVFNLTEELPPSYPGLFQRYDMGAWARTYKISRWTLKRLLDQLESAGAIERSYALSTRKMQLVRMKRYPLLNYPERISFVKKDDYLVAPEVLKINVKTGASLSCVVSFLERHIGYDRRVVKRGWLSGQDKYFQPKKDASRVDIEKYLQGHRYHLYGSRPLLANGMTRVVVFDFDLRKENDKRPLLDAHCKAIQQQLGLSGFTSVYAKRNPGRGHLMMLFSAQVHAEAARSVLLQASPLLATCDEVYPVGKCANRAISWPLFYIGNDDKVNESPMIAYYPACPGIPLESPGIRSDCASVEHIFSTAINDASLIPPLEPEPESQNQKIDLSNLSASADIAEAIARADFNACHTVTEVLDMRVGERFLSPWRFPRESMASCVVYEDHVWDFGEQEHNPYHDAYDCHLAKLEGAL